ncbi:MAG: endonuclease/exonuclease/phosphatase family protein [Alphaproteobacteria bacterium]
MALVSVASYNIRKSVGTDWRRKPDRILAVLREIDADIVALQEVDRRFGSRETSLAPELIEQETDYQLIHFGAKAESVGWHGNAILARRGIGVAGSRRLVLPALEPRGAAMADLSVNGSVLRIIGMHLGLLGMWRRRQARAVLNQLEDLEHRFPTVLMGDLNEWSTHGGCIAEFARHHHVAETGPSFHSKRPVSALDRIMTSQDLRIEAAGVHVSDNARLASDHLPIWARIEVPEPRVVDAAVEIKERAP